MRILFLAGYLPAPPTFGAARRLYGLMSHLAERHSLTALALVEAGPDRSAEIRATRELCERVTVVENERTGIPRVLKRGSKLASLLSLESYEHHAFHLSAFQDALDRLLEKRTFDLVNVESVLLGGYRIPREIPVVLDEHNIEYEILTRTAARTHNPIRRIYNEVNAGKLRREEESLWRTVDGCAVPSDRDEAIVRAAAPRTLTAVVPNGVDTSFFLPRRAVGEAGNVLFFGALNYYPNIDALAFLTGQIMPRLRERTRAHLRVVGTGASPSIRSLSSDDVEIVGEVPDVRPVLDDAAVVVAPLRFGGGTRLKILEAMAMGRPVVSTTIGAEGIGARNGEHIMIADDAPAFAAAVKGLLDDASLRRAIGEAGRYLVEQRYDWRQSTAQLERLQNSVLTRHAGSTLLPAATPVRKVS